MNITEQLAKLDIEGSRAKVYLAILELGRATVIDIAEKTRIKRTTVYDIIVDLLHRGYVAEAKRGKRRFFIAQDPAVLIGKFEQRLLDIKAFVPLLSQIYSKSVPKPTIRFYDGVEGARNIMEEILTSQSKEHLWWSQVGDLVDLLGHRYISQWVRRRVRRGIANKILLTPKHGTPAEYLQSSPLYLRTIHWLPSKIIFEGVLGIIDHKVVYISSRKESFGFIVESEEFTKTLRQIFEVVWGMTSETK